MSFRITILAVTAVVDRAAEVRYDSFVLSTVAEQVFGYSGGGGGDKGHKRSGHGHDRNQQGIGDGNGIHPGFRGRNQKSSGGAVIGALFAQRHGCRQDPARSQRDGYAKKGRFKNGGKPPPTQVLYHRIRIQKYPQQSAD